MKQAESEEPGSIKYNVQHWKKQRNSRLTEHAAEIAMMLLSPLGPNTVDTSATALCRI